MTGLSETQRTALERVVIHARATMEDDLAATLRGQYGISPDGTIEDEARLADDEHLRTFRRALLEILNFFRAGGADEAEAVDRLVREATFTHVNRLIAIRVADALEVLPPSLRDGTRSEGFLQILQLAPLLATYDDTGGYWTYLQFCADELASDVPALFDPRNPMLALRPSRATIESIVAALTDGTEHDIWSADDTFGWAYQFFNTGDERKAMRDASAAPRDSRELAVRNQFFTPRYVVDFLTQNTLGRRLLDANPSSGLLRELPLLIDPPTEQGAPHELADTRVLDPACGSGHFLLGCYEILEKAWALQGVEPREAAPKIVPCLWGIDIDPRAVQVAQAAVIFRARKACGTDPLPPPNITTARALPDDEAIWKAATAGLTTERRQLVHSMREALRDAPTLGTLLKAEERLTKEIRSTVPGANPEDVNLFSAHGLADDAFGHAERDVIRALQQAADLAESSVADRLLAANANDAIRFLEAVRHRYDAVLMNPPFGLAPPQSEAYLRTEYPGGWTDLYAAFTFRALGLLKPHGRVGSLTSNTYFATRKLVRLRERMIKSNRPAAIIDLGPGVLQGAGVNTSVQVLTDSSAIETLYLDLTPFPPAEKEEQLALGLPSASRFALERFMQVDGSPFAFHVADQINNWSGDERFEPAIGVVRSGGNTFDNFRFLRCRWEVDPELLPSDWVPYQKGGEYAPYWCPSHLVVDWRGDGSGLKSFGRERGVLPQIMQSSSLWYRSGICYPRMNSRGALGARLMPAGEIFSGHSISIFLEQPNHTLPVLGLLNSTPVARLTKTFGRGRNIENSAVKRLPVGPGEVDRISAADDHVRRLIEIFLVLDSHDETSSSFIGYRVGRSGWLSMVEQATEEIPLRQQAIDEVVARSLGVGPADDIEPRGELMVSLVKPLGNGAEWARRLIGYLVGVGFGRWNSSCPGSRIDGDYLAPVPSRPPAAGDSYWPNAHLASPRPKFLTMDASSPVYIIDILERAVLELGLPLDVLDQAVNELRVRDLSEYLRRFFWTDHLERYSKSRRQAPLYWHLTLPSGLWSVVLYSPHLSRETLYQLLAEIERRVAVGNERLRLAQEGAGASTRAKAKEAEIERSLLAEIGQLHKHISEVARCGWEPDHNDGVALNAAPFADWFPKNSWKQLSGVLSGIRVGEYDWSRIHQYRGQL